MMKWLYRICLAIGIAFTSLMAMNSYASELPKVSNPQDPYEKFNRLMFQFNDVILDRMIMKPIATVYSTIVPKPLVKGIGNFFSNIDNVPTIANDLLQANFYQAASDSWRLAINTTVGIGGLFDVAANMGLERNSEDLGLTFAQWGYKNSNYLVMPFLGPTTVRDTIAWPINYYALTIYPYVEPPRSRYVLYGMSLVSKRADLLRFQDVMDQAALDRYAFIRNAFMQRRAYQIERNKQLGDPYTHTDDLEKDNTSSS